MFDQPDPTRWNLINGAAFHRQAQCPSCCLTDSVKALNGN